MTPVRAYAEMTAAEKARVADAVDALVAALAAETGLCPEAVANAAFFRLQKHPAWGRNASPAQKRAAYAHRAGRCHRCGQPVEFPAAKFHHLSRGVPGQHGPGNLVPEHTACHDREHNVTNGSLAKGAPRKKRPVAGEEG